MTRRSKSKPRRRLVTAADLDAHESATAIHRARIDHHFQPHVFAVDLKPPDGDWDRITRDFGEPLLFDTEGEAEEYKRLRKQGLTGWQFRIVQVPKDESRMLKNPHTPNKISSPKLPTEEIPQVELRVEIGNRKFGVKSTCRTESDFHRELASTLVAKLEQLTPDDAVEVVRELLPHIADLVCIYRDYKCDRVQRQMMYLAGDLELPTE